MGDVEDGELELGAQLVEQVEHFETDRDVEHRNRLVGQQDARLGSKGSGDGDALALPARELMGVFGEELLGRRQADPLGRRSSSASIAFWSVRCWCRRTGLVSA